MDECTHKQQSSFVLKKSPHLALFCFVFSLLFASFFFFAPIDAATPPPIITYQGKLLVNSSSATTTRAMGFLVYNAETDGNLIYTASGTLSSTTTINVTPTQGIFSVDLGGTGTNALPTSTFQNNHTLYIEVIVAGQVLSPRKRITSIPYSINSEYLMGIAATSTSSSTYIPHADQFGNFTFSGNSRSTLVSGALLYLNPTSSMTNGALFGIAVNGSQRFKIDADGDVTVSSTVSIATTTNNYTLAVSGTAYITGTTTIADRLFVPGKVLKPQRASEGLTNPNTVDPVRLAVQGNFAYLLSATTSNDSFNVIDFQDPDRTRTVATVASSSLGNFMNRPQGIAVQGNYAYVVSSVSDALTIIDISNPAAPVFVGALAHGGQTRLDDPRDIVVQDGYAYISSNDTPGLEVVDISDPRNPRHAAALAIGSSHTMGIAVSGQYVYYIARGTNAGLHIIDVSRPSDPREVGSLLSTAGGNVKLDAGHRVVVQGNYAYVTNGSSAGAFNIIDVTNPTSPRLASSTTNGVGGAVLSVPYGLVVAGRYAYIGSNDMGVISVYDVASSTQPKYVGTLDHGTLTGLTHMVGQGNYLLCANTSGLCIVDVTGAAISNAEIGALKSSSLQVLNRALFDQSVSIRGGLSVGNGLFVSGDFSISAPTSSISASNTLRFTHPAFFTASATTGTAFTFNTANTVASSTLNYLFSVRNNGMPLFSISSNGDARVDRNLFASSSIIGTPGAPGDLAENVDIAPDDTVEPGDVVIVDAHSPDTYRRSTEPYDSRIAGVVSTNPTIIVGSGKTTFTANLAMVGRVPIKISTENGAISRGDLLVSASIPGYAMKYDPENLPTSTKPIGIIGVALDDFSGASSPTSTILGLVRAGWVRGQQTLTVRETSENTIAFTEGSTHDFGNAHLINVASVRGSDNLWEIDPKGRFISRIRTGEGTVEVYGVGAPYAEYALSGSAQLEHGERRVSFDATAEHVFDQSYPITVIVTLTGEEDANPLRVSEKSTTGFMVRETHGGASSATFDWVARGHQRGDGVEEAPPPPADEPPPPVEEPAPPTPTEASGPQEEPVIVPEEETVPEPL